MVIQGDIKANGQVVLTWVAIRTAPGASAGDPGPDTISSYTWVVIGRASLGSPRQQTGVVDHRYGDGAVALATKILAAAGAQNADATGQEV